MEPVRMLVAFVLLSSVVVPVPRPAARVAPAEVVYQLLSNPGLEQYAAPYTQFQGIPCQVANDWQRFWTGTSEPCWMDTRVFATSDLGVGWVERIEGETSQMILSTEPYDAGIWQQVDGLVPGRGYGFHAAMLTIFQTSAPPALDGKMIKQVGIDPAGGTDPRSADIVWSPPDGHDEGPWDIDAITAAYARASTVTVFIRVNSPYPSGGLPLLNLSFLDSAILAQTGSVSAVAPAETAEASFRVRWDNAVPSPGGTIRWYDVQWLDEAEGAWHDWFIWTTDTDATFTGTMGHAYRFRARVWQRYPNGAHLFSPYAAEGDARTFVGLTETVWGRVLGHDGRPLSGATVALSASGYAATSEAGGAYSLSFPSSDQPVSVAASAQGWTSPPPLFDLNLAPQESLAMTWTLSLPGDALANGDFEAGLEDWSYGPGVQAVGDQAHTGHGAVRLAPSQSTASVGQTAAIGDAWEPALAFWYRAETAGPGDTFEVLVTVDGDRVAEPSSSSALVPGTGVLRPSLAAEGWQFFTWRPGPADAFLTGNVSVEFRLLEDGQAPAAVLYLDEVRLAPTPGGPFKAYLPLLNRQF